MHPLSWKNCCYTSWGKNKFCLSEFFWSAISVEIRFVCSQWDGKLLCPMIVVKRTLICSTLFSFQAVPYCLEAVLSHPNNVFLDILGSGRIQTWLLEQFVYKPLPFIILGVHLSFNSGVLLLLWAMGKLATLFLTTEILFVFYSVLISSSFFSLLQLCSFYSW